MTRPAITPECDFAAVFHSGDVVPLLRGTNLDKPA